jgi:hypothetical protein
MNAAAAQGKLGTRIKDLESGILVSGSTFTGENGETIGNETNGIWSMVGAVNFTPAGGTAINSAGLLGGSGTGTGANATVLGAAGGKAFSFYLKSTSTTASHEVTGFYMNVDYGTSGASAAPYGSVMRGRAYLVGDAATGTVAGGDFTVELAATTASSTGLTVGSRSNLVLPTGVLTNSGTYYGAQAQVYLGGAAVDTRAYTRIAPLCVEIAGTAATSSAQLSNMGMVDFNLPANMIGAAEMFITGNLADTCEAKLRVYVNGTPYWLMLSNNDD